MTQSKPSSSAGFVGIVVFLIMLVVVGASRGLLQDAPNTGPIEITKTREFVGWFAACAYVCYLVLARLNRSSGLRKRPKPSRKYKIPLPR